MSAALDVSELLTDPDFCRTITRVRVPRTLANEGLASEGTPVSSPIVGVVEPASQADLKLLPEGTRLVDMVGFYTTGDVQIGGASSEPDQLVVDGVYHVALHVEDFRAAGGYIHVLAQRVPA